MNINECREVLRMIIDFILNNNDVSFFWKSKITRALLSGSYKLLMLINLINSERSF